MDIMVSMYVKGRDIAPSSGHETCSLSYNDGLLGRHTTEHEALQVKESFEPRISHHLVYHCTERTLQDGSEQYSHENAISSRLA
jgi:hypothetical protein